MAIIERAEVVCLTISSKAWTPLLSLNGIGIELGEIVFILENTLLTSQSITMYGTATLKAVTESIQLILSCDLNTKGPVEVAFAVSRTDSLQSLSGALGFEAIMSSAMLFSWSPLSSLPKTSDLVVVFTQLSKQTDHYTISRISATTSSDDWTSFLPSSFPLKKLLPTINLEVSLDVLYLLLPKRRAVGVSIALELQSVAGKTIILGFAAHPLGAFGDYEHRLYVNSLDSGISIADITSALGVSGDVDVMQAAGSPVSQLLNNVRIRFFSAAVEKKRDQYEFSDWSLDLAMNQLEILEDILPLSDVSVDPECVGSVLTGGLMGSIQIESTVLKCKHSWSYLASSSRGSGHQEVWWITRNGEREKYARIVAASESTALMLG
ncbi:uncharacterized protein BKA55DRAFT_706672 [Fusarium redolens]|uniref:Uncharacterized protein n=1 Tax=Fusarium redolens TaxID=48865 RepID=A0A9P9GLG6_FUSRE|nr:uncharacterized protein BKA55DRAFT_706672 [Fusarium redolens]KAH7240144.1 hypothetical protein BKA55DRAFT_706672 [Fusarium redolens]